MGEPGPLSPEDSERLSEDRLRLVWRSDACLVIFLKSDVLFLLPGKAHAQRPHPQRPHPQRPHPQRPHPQRPHPPEGPRPSSPVLSFFGLHLLIASGHFGLVARLPGGANLDRRVFKGGGGDGDFGAALWSPDITVTRVPGLDGPLVAGSSAAVSVLARLPSGSAAPPPCGPGRGLLPR